MVRAKVRSIRFTFENLESLSVPVSAIANGAQGISIYGLDFDKDITRTNIDGITIPFNRRVFYLRYAPFGDESKSELVFDRISQLDVTMVTLEYDLKPSLDLIVPWEGDDPCVNAAMSIWIDGSREGLVTVRIQKE